jgi:hypothetical protein
MAPSGSQSPARLTTSSFTSNVFLFSFFTSTTITAVPFSNDIIITTTATTTTTTMALQPFVGPWPLFQFLDPIHSR